MAYTTKIFLGLCASMLLSGAAFGQALEDQNQYSALSFDRAATETSTDNPQSTIEPTTQMVVIDSSIYYEDFRDSLDGWTFELVKPSGDTLLWEYQKNANLATRTNDTRYKTITSPTAANGFLWFDYRDYAIPRNPSSGARPYVVVDQTAVTPAIDLSMAVAGNTYSLVWYNYSPTLTERNQRVLIVSGADSTVIWNIKDDIDRPNTAPQAQVFAKIPAKYYGRSNVKFKFVYDSEFYGWAIDDIFIGVTPTNELNLNPDFIATPANYATPVSQVGGQNIYFVTDVQNTGGITQTPKVKATIFKVLAAGNELYYQDSITYPGVPADSTFENNVFDSYIGMPTEAGRYRIVYEVSSVDDSEPDFDSSNNSASWDFFVQSGADEVEYWRAAGVTGGWTPGATSGSAGDFEWGNIYLTPNLGTSGLRIDSIDARYSVQGYSDSQDEAFFELRTYGFKGDLNDDGIPSIDDGSGVENAELVLLGTRFFSIAPGTANGDKRLRVAPGEDQELNPIPVVIPAGQGYIGYAVGFSYVQGSARGTLADNFFVSEDDRVNIGATNLALEDLVERGVKDRNNEYYTYRNNRAQTVDGAGYDLPYAFFINTKVTVLDLSGTTELVANTFTLAPNPASTEVNITFDFGDNTTGVTFKVFNGVGQQVMHLNQPVSPSGRITIPVASLNQGVYFVTASAQDGASTTRRILIQR